MIGRAHNDRALATRVFAILLTAASGLYLLALCAYFVALAAGRARAGPLGLIRELTPYLLVPVALLLGAGVVVPAPSALILSVPSLVMVAIALKPVWAVRRRPARQSAPPTRFRILTFNAGGNTGAPEVTRVEQTVGRLNADVVALQELTPETLARLRGSLARRYAYSQGEWPAIVFSRFPIRAGSSLSFPSRGSDAQRVEIDIAGRTLIVFNMHITRPGHELDGRLTRLRLAGEYDPTARDTHAALVHRQAGSAPGPCVVVGDLNATEWSHPYRLLGTTLVDAFREAARGWGNTYRVSLGRGRWQLRVPLVRIDYIFHSRHLVSLGARTGPGSGSDHLPVVADLALR